MSYFKEFLDLKIKEDDINRCVIKLTTEYYVGKDGSLNYKKVLKPLLKKCINYGRDMLLEDAQNGGVDCTLQNIINLDICGDGIYEVVTCNITRDWETGYVDSWEYQLVPYKETMKQEDLTNVNI